MKQLSMVTFCAAGVSYVPTPQRDNSKIECIL